MAVARRTGSMLDSVVIRSLGSTQASSRAAGKGWQPVREVPLCTHAASPLALSLSSILPSPGRTLIEPGRQVLQDVIYPRGLQVALCLDPLFRSTGLLCILFLRASGAGRGQRQQGIGLVQEAWGAGEEVSKTPDQHQDCFPPAGGQPRAGSVHPMGCPHTIPSQEAQAISVALLAHLSKHLWQGDG
jgi:hypothetical protein